MKYCPYCGAAHNNRGRACSPEHAKRITSMASQATGKRRLARIAERRQAKLVHEDHWRNVAMGRDADEHLAAIFGLDKMPGKESQ